MGRKRKAANNVKNVPFDNEKKKLLKKSDADSYYDQDDWLEKYAERGQYKWSSDENSDDNLDMSSEESDFENDPETETRHQKSFTIISTDVLQKMLKTFAVCKNCGGRLEIVEKISLFISAGAIALMYSKSSPG